MPSGSFLLGLASEARIDGLGESDVIPLGVSDHYGPDPVARCPIGRVDAQLVQLCDLLFNTGHNEGKGAGTSTFGKLIDLQRSAALEAPFSNFRHRPGWRAVEKLFIPPHR